jgi:hypothetical protein
LAEFDRRNESPLSLRHDRLTGLSDPVSPIRQQYKRNSTEIFTLSGSLIQRVVYL